MRVISYVTSEYKAHGRALQKNLEEHGILGEVDFIHSWGNAKLNKLWKPFFLEKKRTQFPNETLVFVDGDSRFLSPLAIKKPKAELGLVLTGKPGYSYWFADSIHFHNPGPGENKFISVWKFLCSKTDLVGGNNHPRILATFSLLLHEVTFESVALNGCFARNFGQPNQIVL
jgi:hypothetical protein